MDQLIRELERVRRTGRLLLITQRLAQWVGMAAVAVLACGLIDYALRLPGWFRLAVGVLLAISAVGWLVTRIPRAARFNPSLPVLALRAEKVYPQLSGVLASGIEFVTHADELRPPRGSPATEELASLTLAQLHDRAREAGSLRALVKTEHTLRQMAATGLAVLAVAVVVFAAPAASLLAAQRWFNPLGPAQWPKRTQVQAGDAPAVWPVDSPLSLEALVTRGYKPGMRVELEYRLINIPGDDGAVREAIMSEQAGAASRGVGRFQRLIDLVQPHAGSDRAVGDDAWVEYRFIAGDDQTEPQRVRLVERPALRAVTAVITPPEYAQPLVPTQTVALHEKGGQLAAASALVGSHVQLRLELSKPIPSANANLSALAPDLGHMPQATIDVEPVGDDRSRTAAVTIGFQLDQTRRTTIQLVDEHGLSSQSERQYAIEAVEDNAPAVSMVEPAADESVLPTAVVPVRAVATDDVGLESLTLRAQRHPAPAPNREASPDAPIDLLRQPASQPQAEAAIDGGLALAPLELVPGDRLELTAVAQDVFRLGDDRHDPVVSNPRVLRIIDPATLISQVRNELAGLRQQALRLSERQLQLLDVPAPTVAPQQRQMTGHLDAQEDLLQRLTDRVVRNRLDDADGGLKETLRRASDLVDQAHTSSQEAQQDIDQAQRATQEDQAQAHRESARQNQTKTAQALSDLVALLDQGRDALALELQLRQIATQQEHMLAQTRQTMPRTVGQTPDQLDPKDRAQLEELKSRQENLAEQTKNLLQQMQATADALSRSSQNPREQATAQALSQAASIAQRQGLSGKMEQAGSNLAQNQLAQASQGQEESLAIVRDMLAQMQQQDQRRQEILRRQLAQLRQALERLIAQQEAEIAALDQANDGAIAGLEPGQARLRRNTQSVSEMARSAEPPIGGPPGTGKAADQVDYATDAQGQAILSLRQASREPAAEAQNKALTHLVTALEFIKEAQRQNELEQLRKQRQELRTEYEKLAQWQDQLLEQTVALGQKHGTDAARLTRQQRAEVVALGHAEDDLRLATEELGRRVSSDAGPVFDHMHAQVSAVAQRASTRLWAGHADEHATTSQKQVAHMLRDMAEALKDDPSSSEFAQSGGGGGGGGAGGRPPLVPPAAELKLLRNVQESIYQATRAAHAEPDTDPELHRRDLLRLGASQRELAGIGEKLIQKMQGGLQEPAP